MSAININKLTKTIFTERVKIVFVFQSLIIYAAQILSIILATNFQIDILSNKTVIISLLIISMIRGILLIPYKLHHGLWRYTNPTDIKRIVQSTTLGSIPYLFIIYFFISQKYIYNILIIDFILIISSLTSIRFISRLIRERKSNNINKSSIQQKNLLIIGAGIAGTNLCQNIKENQNIDYLPVAFADDDEEKLGAHIFDIPVAGKTEEIPSIIERFKIEIAVYAIPSANPKQKSRVIHLLNKSGVKFKILPGTPDVLAGNVNMSNIRKINPLDILGRPAAELNDEELNDFIKGKCVLITGAGGSVGSDLARQTSNYNPQKLVILDQIENPLLFLESEIKSHFPKINLITLIADITDKISTNKIIAKHQPDIILHAAAHKHVPFMESNPSKAIKNNVGGTLTIALSAIEHKVNKFVLVSTDKAANPSSVMGVTKRIGELLIGALQEIHTETKFVSVRFGNVFGSNASVVPVFEKQIETGGPITVTHPEATRYFMSIQEATGLILQAGAIGKGGEIFVLDMGEPINIVDLAKTMISIYGLESEIDITFMGLRPGEKLHEILNTESEKLQKTDYSRILMIETINNNSDIINLTEKLLEQIDDMTEKQITDKLVNLAPNYTPSN